MRYTVPRQPTTAAFDNNTIRADLPFLSDNVYPAPVEGLYQRWSAVPSTTAPGEPVVGLLLSRRVVRVGPLTRPAPPCMQMIGVHAGPTETDLYSRLGFL